VLAPNGDVLQAAVMDGQLPIGIETAQLKAKTALYARGSSSSVAQRFNTVDGRLIRLDLGKESGLAYYFVGGGLPIVVEDQIIGAIGVGGGNQDEQCAHAALTKVLGPQPPLTPPPAPGAKDSWGAALSSVATTGDAAPPMPADTGQGTGKRVVYDRAGQRVWAVDDQERVVRSYLVTGSQYHNEIPGRHEVYSRSEVSTAWNGQAYLPLMIRWLDTERGAIGFHGIPTHISDGTAYQTDAELGQKLSGGCQRQSNLDAAFLWQFAQIGTPVYVT